MRKFIITTLALPVMLFTTPSFAFSIGEPCFGYLPEICEAPTAGDRNGSSDNERSVSGGRKGKSEGRPGRPGHGHGDNNHDHSGPPGQD